jgi:hypothetical protein
MKKLFVYSAALFVGAASIFSCRQRDVVAPTVVQQSNTPNGTRSYNFAVLVVPASLQGKAEGLSGVSVTISQGQNIQVQSTNADGIANFTGLNEGNIAWTVASPSTSGTNFGSVSGLQTFNITTGMFNEPNQSNQVGGVSVIVPLAAKTATLSGRLVSNADFNSSTQLAAAAGVLVRLTYNITNSYRLEPNFYVATTDANGSFTFSNVPALDNLSIDADLTAELITPNGSQTVKFTLGSINLSSNELGNGKSFNLGTRELTAEGINTSTVTGVLYGDFNFLTTSNGGTLSFGPAVTNTDYINQATTAGEALSTLPGFSSSGFVRAGIVVKLTYTGLPSGQLTEYVTTTDATGRYSFANVPATGGGVTAEVSASIQLPKVNSSNGLTEQISFSETATVSVDADRIQDFGAQEMD